MTSYRFRQPVLVSPRGAAPYEAQYAQPGPAPTLLWVRQPHGRGLHMVAAEAVTPMSLGLGDAVAAQHAGGTR